MRFTGYNKRVKNNAHRNESKEDRLRRFQNNSYVESIETLLNSIDNFFNNEIQVARDNKQTSLLFMGIHAVALIISEAFFSKSGLDGYKLFLETYVDGDEDDKKFSKIATTIHDWRNILAHQWIGSTGHDIGYDYEMDLGWQTRNEVTFINPKIYCEQYLSVFRAGGRMWSYKELFSEEQLEEIKSRIIAKYVKK